MFAKLLILCMAAYVLQSDAKPLLRKKNNELRPTCPSKIYCQGDLLHTVQMAQIYNDSKTFVDMRIRGTVDKTLDNFHDLMKQTNNNPTKEEISNFVFDNFEHGSELEYWQPPDFKENPEFLEAICDEEIKNFAAKLVHLWSKLGRKVRPEVSENPDHYSLIAIPNGFTIPGGRFREIYYWDSYWIIKGLLISEMTETVRGMVDNFIFMVKKYGFVPNGGRVYYTERSQPPLLTHMAHEYVQFSQDLKWLNENIQYLDKELRYWLDSNMIHVNKGGVDYKLAIYSAPSKGPRPESYREDVKTAAYFTDEAKQQEVYNNLKSAAESGWDFSTRWVFDSAGSTNANLSYIDTQRTIPVDLNAFLFGAFKDISELYLLLGKEPETEFWLENSLNMQKGIENILWNEEDGIWYDYDVSLGAQRKYFSASNFAPLWTEAYNTSKKSAIANSVVKYLYANNINDYLGGIPTTLDRSGEQWDSPNAWPPLQAIVVQGLERTGDEQAIKLAEEFARNWVTANYIGFEETGAMFEKYDAENPGKYGGGGEYEVQTGFGWTNGIAIEFIKKYYSKCD